MSTLSILLCISIYLIHEINAKGYTIMYADEINEDGDWEIWGVDGFPDNCCAAIKLEDYGNHADGFMGWQSLNPTQNIAWTGYPDNVEYQQLLVETYSSTTNTFQITKQNDGSSAVRYLVMGYIPSSPCNSSFNATALFIGNPKKRDKINYGCVNIENGRWHSISENEEHYDLFDNVSPWSDIGSVYDPINNQFLIGFYDNIPPYSHIIITINANDGTDYRERMIPGGYMPFEVHYSSAIKTGYPAILVAGGGNQGSGYGMYNLQTKDFQLILNDAPFATMTPIGNSNIGIAMDGNYNVYKFDLNNG
eukprot:44594_1